MANQQSNQNFILPSRGDKTAPQFDPKRLRELRRFFSELEYLFDRAGNVSNEEKKRHVTRYADVDACDLWETLSEFKDNTNTFKDFKKAIYELYPGSEGDHMYTVGDMDQVVGEWSRLEVKLLGDLGDYYRRFVAVTTYLVGKQQISKGEQSRTFMRDLPDQLQTEIRQ